MTQQWNGNLVFGGQRVDILLNRTLLKGLVSMLEEVKQLVSPFNQWYSNKNKAGVSRLVLHTLSGSLRDRWLEAWSEVK